MSFELIPGNALGCRTNAHRHGWNGTICEHAASWNCGIDQDFREKYCENAIPRCFHLQIFDEADPHLIIPDSGVGWILDSDPHAFDDQILLVWAPAAEEPIGVVTGRPMASYMAGIYRIEGAERQEHRNHVEWQVRPHADGWAYMGPLEVQSPRFMHLEGPYIKQVDRTAVDRLIEAAAALAAEVGENLDWTAEDRRRVEFFVTHADEWFAIARDRAPLLRPGRARTILTPARRSQPSGQQDVHGVGRPGNGFLDGVVEERPAPIPAGPPAPMHEPQAHVPLVDEQKRKEIAEMYGEPILTALLVGSMTKPIVILQGEPGVGKSRLAVELIDDVARERTLIVPVSPAWRSGEDLFGCVHSAKNLFEPTEFATFLRRAQLAWDAGDRRTRIVVFEDFDLSPAEGWLAEILARTQYPPECRRDRTIELGGHAVRGWDRGAETSVYLSPAVRFVATIDLDRARRPLSLRVLDRSAVVHLELEPRAALERTGVKVTPKQSEAIVELSRVTAARHASFSLRAALSLKACLAGLDALGVDSWGALDLVLRQEVLVKLELDPSDHDDRRILEELESWSAKYGNKLRECAQFVARWKGRTETARPVLQS